MRLNVQGVYNLAPVSQNEQGLLSITIWTDCQRQGRRQTEGGGRKRESSHKLRGPQMQTQAYVPVFFNMQVGCKGE